jgi:hypothetical protein
LGEARSLLHMLFTSAASTRRKVGAAAAVDGTAAAAAVSLAAPLPSPKVSRCRLSPVDPELTTG